MPNNKTEIGKATETLQNSCSREHARGPPAEKHYTMIIDKDLSIPPEMYMAEVDIDLAQTLSSSNKDSSSMTIIVSNTTDEGHKDTTSNKESTPRTPRLSSTIMAHKFQRY